MTRATFRTLVLNMASGFGENYILNTQDTLLNSLIDERLKLYTKETACLYDDKIAFTLTASTDAYSLRNTSAFAKEMWRVERVYIDGSPIAQADVSTVPLLEPSYITADTSKPAFWWTQPPHDLVLFPVPDVVYSNNYVSGWYLHPDLASDSTSLTLPVEHQRTAARFTALALVEPGKLTGEALNVYRNMEELCRKEMDKARIDASRLHSSFNRRRSTIRRAVGLS